MHSDAAALRKAIRDPNCTSCSLHLDTSFVCLTGDGPSPARLAIYGEAPGGWEEETGIPFVGNAGKYLDRELAKIGIKREDVFVSNAVRCRPDSNRTPTRTELKACRQYTVKELDAVKPEVVLLMGNSALTGLLGMSGITSKRGASIEKDGITYLPTFHPAAILRNPALEQDFRNDLVALKRLLDGDNKPLVTETKVVRNDLDFDTLCRLLLAQDEAICVDIESGSPTARKGAGLEPYADDTRIATIGFAWEAEKAWVLPWEHTEARWGRNQYKPMAARLSMVLGGKKTGGHNLKFDLQWLHRDGIRSVEAKWDTLLMSHLLDENRAHGLKPLARTYLGAELWEEDIDYDQLLQMPIDELATYNGRDVDYNLRLYYILREKLAAQPRLARIYKHISLPTVNTIAAIEMRGFPMRLRRLKARNAEIERKLSDIEAALLLHVPAEQRTSANFRSVPFLQRLLFDTLDLPVGAVSAKTNLPSTAEDVLLSLDHPAVALLLEHRKWTKWHGTYTQRWINRIRLLGRPRIHPSYKLTGTVTGRMSSDMQQVPRDPYIRSIIAAPKGRLLVEADFSQIELRVAAMIAVEPKMMQAFQQGVDIHMLTAQAITGKPISAITKEERARAKPVSFGFLYGMGWRKFIPYAKAQYGIEINDVQSQAYRDAFFNTYPGLRAWHDRQRRIVQAVGKVQSPIGRVRRLPGITSADQDVIAEAERMAINSPVQGLASDLTLLAMSRIEKALDTERGWIIGQIHDSILIEADEDYAEEAGATSKRIMESLPLKELFGWEPTVPILADVKTTRFWGES